VACRASTTEAVQGLMNLVMVPMYLFSGVFFSSERFPNSVQPFIQALPLTQLVSALRRVLLEGAGFIDVSPALAILAAWAVITFCLALRFFRWAWRWFEPRVPQELIPIRPPAPGTDEAAERRHVDLI